MVGFDTSHHMHARMQHLRQDVTPCCLQERAELEFFLTLEKRQKTLSRPVHHSFVPFSFALLPPWTLPGRLARAGIVLGSLNGRLIRADIPHVGQRKERVNLYCLPRPPDRFPRELASQRAGQAPVQGSWGQMASALPRACPGLECVHIRLISSARQALPAHILESEKPGELRAWCQAAQPWLRLFCVPGEALPTP